MRIKSLMPSQSEASEMSNCGQGADQFARKSNCPNSVQLEAELRDYSHTDSNAFQQEENNYMNFDTDRHRAGIWAMIQILFERAKTDPDCLAAAAAMGWGPDVFDEMKKQPLIV